MAKRSSRGRTSTSQRIMQVLGILLALSMILVVLAPLAGGSSSQSNTPTPEPVVIPTTAPEPSATPEPTQTPGAALAPTAESGG